MKIENKFDKEDAYSATLLAQITWLMRQIKFLQKELDKAIKDWEKIQ